MIVMTFFLLGGSKLNVKLWSVLSINQQLSAELFMAIEYPLNSILISDLSSE